MWLRQEYKPEKHRFQQPFELEVNTDATERPTTDSCEKVIVKLEQSYAALGTTVWDGSIALAKMFDNGAVFPHGYLQKCRVIELGAGCGLVGIYVALLGAKMTYVTDQECCIKTLERNLKANIPESVRGKIKVMEYYWGDNPRKLSEKGLFDLVLAAEVLYSPADSVLLAKCIPELSHPETRIFISMGRNRGGEELFVKTMASQGYSCTEVCIYRALACLSEGLFNVLVKFYDISVKDIHLIACLYQYFINVCSTVTNTSKARLEIPPGNRSFGSRIFRPQTQDISPTHSLKIKSAITTNKQKSLLM